MPNQCLDCGSEIKGRVDKKFCSDLCRNAYHNNLKRSDSTLVRNVNNILKKNRAILTSLTPDGKAKVHKNKLDKAGFNFNYHTSVYTTKKGGIYYFCYERGYLAVDDGYYILVLREEN